MTTRLQNSPTTSPSSLPDRRNLVDRRDRFWWSIAYGGFNPRRRGVRRDHPHAFQMVDWHEAHLLAPSVLVVLLCALDAFLTLVLLSKGAHEVNPVMAQFVYSDAKTFTIVKMLSTGSALVILVFLARHRFMRRVPVSSLLYGAVAIYVALIWYEVQLLQRLTET
jgi:hypothetical protein